ncbi:23S rRNA (pseudouridine(1915)-N(3))-methyltransferase RlmH [Aestuariivirga litoralis]|uniref:23S rRNA (pseudouridine(1915)-N(3))-methyltransferase RlmH n=1 Tax=Aestuariivirga litoralis TaxID=2650924 RepID=UPI0018C72A6A|nr:23S rRNA (pseudouridine(1915)-N(3))-methyltransferase RlmH [Aestuariivirga litoralis]MBG1233539.1 23S rRNA (pseudouridine(1915)-N(3))-methyltransferase RlmH [Aestuariivirga litoralis]
MKLHLLAIGKLKSGPEKLMAEDYATRITAMGKKAGVTALKISDWAESQKPDAPSRMGEEETQLWSSIPTGAYVIALDERGKSHTSEAFAAHLRKVIERGNDVVFLIGGPDGHSPGTREKANELLALGQMTWPHRLARIMLLEQIYRSVTIMLNHPYHRA